MIFMDASASIFANKNLSIATKYCFKVYNNLNDCSLGLQEQFLSYSTPSKHKETLRTIRDLWVNCLFHYKARQPV